MLSFSQKTFLGLGIYILPHLDSGGKQKAWRHIKSRNSITIEGQVPSETDGYTSGRLRFSAGRRIKAKKRQVHWQIRLKRSLGTLGVT